MSDGVLDAILETLIPRSADGRMPGAGTLGLGPELRAKLSDLGTVLDDAIAAATDAGLSAMPPLEREVWLRGLEASQPGFVPAVYLTLCTLYYAQPAVLSALGLAARPPFPGGYELEPGDLGVFDAVRARGPRYRSAGD